MSGLKVFVIGTRGFPGVQGGVEKHCEVLYPRLVRLGCEVTVATRSPYISKDRRLAEWEGVKFSHLWAVKNKHLEAFLHTLSGVIAARSASPDLIHFHAIGPSLLVPLAKALGLKVVVTNHGPDYRRKKWGSFAGFMLKAGESMAMKFADEIIVISREIKTMLEERYGRGVELIPNGVRVSGAAPPGETLKKHGLEAGKYVFTACRFVPEKGLADLIAAYRKIDDPPFKLAIAGGADHENDCSREIKKFAEEDGRIVLTGFLSGGVLKELYSNAGLFVLSSYYEGLPLALLEAVSYGVPVLASDIQANQEVPLAPYRYYPVGDVEVLAEKIAELFQRGIDGEEKERQFKFLKEHYDWDRIAEQTFAVYEKAVRKKQPVD